MPGRGAIVFSCALHIALVAMVFLHLPFFQRALPEETPIVVELVNIAPETRATQKTETPPTPQKPPQVAQNEAKPEPKPKPEPPKPEPPKPEPPKPPPPAPPPPPPPPPPPEPKPPEPKPPEPKPEPPKPPEPKPPEPKPEPPKPPEPAPPKPEAKPKPPQPKKDQDVAFDALLKTLAKRQVADTEPKAKDKPAPAPRQASSQPIAPLGSQLSASVIDLVKRQIEACWNVPAGARDAESLRPEFKVLMNPDGTVRSAELLNPNSDPFFQAAADAARRALLNTNCHGPLKFPPEKYDQWQSFTMTFNPKDIT